MTIVTRTLGILLLLFTCAAAPLGAQSPAPKDQQQNEYVPLDQLPPQEQLPAAPLLVSAYAVVLGALFLYVLSISKRLGAVKREMERLESDLKRSGRA